MRKLLVAGLGLALVATTAGVVDARPSEDRGNIRPPGPTSISLTPIGTYETGVFDESAAEIVAHDPVRQRLYVVNARSGDIDVLDVSDPTTPSLLDSLPTGGIANSVALRGDVIAVAVETDPKTDPGQVIFFDTEGAVVNSLVVGAQPDMVTFTPDGRTLLVANEGEPAEDYSVDPEGSVSVIDVRGDIAALTGSDVRTATFHAWDDGERELHPDVRVFGPDEDSDRRVSENLEPEYISVDRFSRTAYVVLQEANAFAVLDIAAATFTDIVPFGFKDHLLPGNEIDVSDRDGEINITNWPIYGMYQPDGFDTYHWRGQTLLVTANEGDSRDWDGYSEESRFRGYSKEKQICDGSRIETWFSNNDLGITDLSSLRDNTNLGRLTITTANGFDSENDCIEDVYAFGGRSFSIWTANGTQLFDSGSEFEWIIADRYPEFFNSNHRQNTFETRSDNKGPEPEDVTIGKIAGRTYAFIVLERMGGIMVYDISDPRGAFFVDYVNNRNFDAAPGTPEAGDLGAENSIFIEAHDSPTRTPLLVVANEVSGTTTVFEVDLITPGNGPRR